MIFFKTQNHQYVLLLRFGSNPRETREEWLKAYSRLEVSDEQLKELTDTLFCPQLHLRYCSPGKELKTLTSSCIGGCNRLMYGDCRDEGYITSLQQGQADRAIFYYRDLCNAFFNIFSHAETIDEWLPESTAEDWQCLN